MAIPIPRNTYERPSQTGLVPAVCCDAHDLGIVETQFGKKHMVALAWQLDEKNSKDAPFVVWRRFTASLDKRASLRKTLEQWRGKPFSDSELDKFDLELVLGAPATILLEEKPSKDGDTFVNVAQVLPLVKGSPVLKVEAGYVRKKDRKDGSAHDASDVPPEDSGVPF